MALLVAAIDFGTTFSGWAFSFKHEFDLDPLKISAKQWAGGQLISLKGPTCVLIEPDGMTLRAFGFEAETKYAELAEKEKHEKWYFYKRFKMALFGDVGDVIKPKLEDATGKELDSIHVFTLAIRYLKDDLIKMSQSQLTGEGLQIDEIYWVITVPAIWNDTAKNFMREAAKKAGIPNDKLTIALEPEVASLFCRHVPIEKNTDEHGLLTKFRPGTKYLVLDAGGGTVDITIHEVTDKGNIKELHKASGGAWGGTRVDEAYRQFIIKLVGGPVMKKFMKKHMEDYIDLFREFETKKRDLTPERTGKITVRLPRTLLEMFEKVTEEKLNDAIQNCAYSQKLSFTSDKLRIEADVVQGFFDESIHSIVDHLKDLFQNKDVRGCSAILMVGGFSESPMLQGAIKKTFNRLKVIIPQEAGLAVLKGAVIFGHHPGVIESRVSKFTYGTDTAEAFSAAKHPASQKQVQATGEEFCTGIFSTLVKAGQTLVVGKAQDEQTYQPVRDDQTKLPMDIYATKNACPRYTSDCGCYKIASFSVPIPVTKGGKDRRVTVKTLFGGTEITVECTDQTTGKVTMLNVDYQN